MSAGAPVPESCTVGDRPFTSPLESIGFFFDGGIKLLDGASAVVKCDGETVATASRLEVNNSDYKTGTQGILGIYFESQLLPKGKEYTLSIAPASIASEADGAENAEIKQSFSVPENLGEAWFDVKDGVTIDKTTASGGLYSCYWGIETEPVGDPYFILYREGVAVREIPARVSWDFDLGQAHPQVSEEMCFEKGVHYSLVLPAGSAHARYRDDIVNEKVMLNFIGGYEEPVPQLNYTWCSLYNDHSDVLNVVTFRYDRPVRVAEGAKIQLWEGDCKKLVMEADAYLDTLVNCWDVSADFGGFRMESEAGYTFVIPEGAVIAETGDPVVNPRNVLSVGGGAGVDSVLNGDADADAPIYDLSGRRVTSPRSGSVYIRAGKKILGTAK